MEQENVLREAVRDAAADMLREELSECRDFIKEMFKEGRRRPVDGSYPSHPEMSLAMRLIEMSTQIASAITELEGTRQQIVVTRPK